MLSIDAPAGSRAEPGRDAATCRCGLGRHAKKESGAAADREVVDARARVKSWTAPRPRRAPVAVSVTGPRNAGLTSARRPVALQRPALLPQLSSGARERLLAPVVATPSERVQEVTATPQRVVRARVLPLSLALFTSGPLRASPRLAPRGAACSPPRAPSGAFLRTGPKNKKNARVLCGF